MNIGRVASIHIHPPNGGAAMITLSEINVEEGNGIVEDKRYYRRRSQSSKPSRRQITLIEREIIREHASALGCSEFEPGAVRSNIETEAIDLVPLAGRTVQIGSAQILIGAPRDPCEKMDALQPGLKKLMDGGRQGVLGEIILSGSIRVGDEIRVL